MLEILFLERINVRIRRTPVTYRFTFSLLNTLNDFVDEIIISTMAGNAEDRKRSFELIAGAFELRKQKSN